MVCFIDQHSILNLSQYGFRQGHSTHHAIIDIVEAIQLNMDRRLFTCGIFIDLKKAIDGLNAIWLIVYKQLRQALIFRISAHAHEVYHRALY